MNYQDGDLLHNVAYDTPPPRILLAENHAETRALLASSLRKDGYDVLEVTSGRELLARIGSSLLGNSGRPPDLVVTDVRMPGPDGLKMLAGLRRSWWLTPVIVVTAVGDAHVHAEAKRLGAYAVFARPFDLADFRTAVVNAAGASRPRQDT